MSKPSLINENINRIYTFWLNSAGWNILKIKCPCCQFWFRHTVQKVDLRPCCLKEFALLAHESETSWFPYLFLSKSWRKTNCWNVYTARIRPCCVLEASLPRLRDKRFCVFCVACDNFEPNRYVIWSALKCQSTLDFFSSEPSCHF